MNKIFASTLVLLSPLAFANPLGPFEITLPEDYNGLPSINDRDFSWTDLNEEKYGTQIEVLVEKTASNRIDVQSDEKNGHGLRSYWEYSVNDASIEIDVVSAIRVNDGLQVQLVVTESKCGKINCADYTGTNKNKVNTRDNYPVGETFVVGFAFNDNEGNNLEIPSGSNNEKNYRKMKEVGAQNVLLVNPAPFLNNE